MTGAPLHDVHLSSALDAAGRRNLTASLLDAARGADARAPVAPRSVRLCAALGELAGAVFDALAPSRDHALRARVTEAAAALSLLTKVDDKVIDGRPFHGGAGAPRDALRRATAAYLAPTLDSLRAARPRGRRPTACAPRASALRSAPGGRSRRRSRASRGRRRTPLRPARRARSRRGPRPERTAAAAGLARTSPARRRGRRRRRRRGLPPPRRATPRHVAPGADSSSARRRPASALTSRNHARGGTGASPARTQLDAPAVARARAREQRGQRHGLCAMPSHARRYAPAARRARTIHTAPPSVTPASV
jgi:hypothetical protein